VHPQGQGCWPTGLLSRPCTGRSSASRARRLGVHAGPTSSSRLDCAYAPMVELLGYLNANGFSNYIASGGGRDFMRPISQDVYGIPRERVIGSSTALEYTSDDAGGVITRKGRPTISTMG
jgi:hypothetical protein